MSFAIYAGNMGFGHRFDEMVMAIEALFEAAVISKFYWIGSGKRKKHVESLITESRYAENFEILGFLGNKEFDYYVHNALFHAIVLSKEKTGVMVPSKFYTSIESGKPVLYFGSLKSELALDINQYNLGFAFDSKSIPAELKSIDWQALSQNCLDYKESINNARIAAGSLINFIESKV
jgi:colanic acid biosynthesis glycosyl transferase WcaI